MTTSEKCEAIIRKINEIANRDGKITFERDFGGNTLTLIVENLGHTHVGTPSGTFEFMVNNLYRTLHGRSGFSTTSSTQINENRV